MREAEAASARRRTLVLVNLTSMLEKADEVLLPAVYREVGLALGVSVTALGSLTLCRALVQALSFPLAAYASARYDRASVVAVGAFLWAAATFLVAISRTYLQVSSASRHPLPHFPPSHTHWRSGTHSGALF
jgi:MFS family permease